MLEDDGITAAIEELQSRLGDLQNSIDQALQVTTSPLSFLFACLLMIITSAGRSVRKSIIVSSEINTTTVNVTKTNQILLILPPRFEA